MYPPPPKPPAFAAVVTELQVGRGSPGAEMRAMIERAAAYVTDLGYPIDAVTLSRVDDPMTDGEPTRRRHTMLVNDRPCFEVIVEIAPWVDGQSTATTTPRVIAWPPPRG